MGDATFKIAGATDASIDVCDLWVVTANGIAGPRRFAIDELPTLVEKEENESRDHAQAISVPSVIDAKLDRAADLERRSDRHHHLGGRDWLAEESRDGRCAGGDA